MADALQPQESRTGGQTDRQTQPCGSIQAGAGHQCPTCSSAGAFNYFAVVKGLYWRDRVCDGEESSWRTRGNGGTENPQPQDRHVLQTPMQGRALDASFCAVVVNRASQGWMEGCGWEEGRCLQGSPNPWHQHSSPSCPVPGELTIPLAPSHHCTLLTSLPVAMEKASCPKHDPLASSHACQEMKVLQHNAAVEQEKPERDQQLGNRHMALPRLQWGNGDQLGLPDGFASSELFLGCWGGNVVLLSWFPS